MASLFRPLFEGSRRTAHPIWPGTPSWLDASAVALIVTNLVVIGVAIVQGWDIGTVLWIYWSQSVIIGVFQFAKIVSLKEFTTEGLLVNGEPVEPTRKTLWKAGLFFLVHYGIFHLAYLFFLVLEVPLSLEARDLVYSGTLLFLLNHGLSFVLNYRWDTARQQNLGRVMVIPYARIVPMHLAIIFSFFFLQGAGFVAFMLLKTAADTAMHVAEHA
jgi:hypothetical protein